MLKSSNVLSLAIVVTLTISILSLFSFQQVSAEAKIGVKIPHTLDLKNQDNRFVTFKSLMGEKGAVLVFVRSVSWCPFCQEQLQNFDKHAGEFKEKGYNIVSISYDDVYALKEFQEKYDVSFPLLSDNGSKAIKDFGILNTEFEPGSRFYGIPYPTVYVVDKNGIIQHIFAEEGYRERPDISVIKSHL